MRGKEPSSSIRSPLIWRRKKRAGNRQISNAHRMCNLLTIVVCCSCYLLDSYFFATYIGALLRSNTSEIILINLFYVVSVWSHSRYNSSLRQITTAAFTRVCAIAIVISHKLTTTLYSAVFSILYSIRLYFLLPINYSG